MDQQKVDAANSIAKNSQHVQLTVNGGELSVKTDRGVSSTSGLTVPASGLSMIDVIVDAIIVGLLLLIWFCSSSSAKKIAARAKGRERRAASAAALGAAAGVATGYGATRLMYRTAIRHRVFPLVSPVTCAEHCLYCG